MSRQINPFQDNDLLKIGRMIHQDSYSREKKEIQIDHFKFDLVRNEKGSIVIGEIKKSSRFEESSKMQLAFYLWILKDNYGINATGELLFPEEKKRVKIVLDDELENKLKMVCNEIESIIGQEEPPQPERIIFCKKCAYQEFCWA